MRRGPACIAALCLVATIGPAVPARGQTPVIEDERVAIQELLDRRAQAYLAHDRTAFLATIDPDATSFRRDQERMFRFAGSIRFASYELVADWGRYGDLARPSDREAYADAEAVAIPLTQERYRVKGFDPRPAVEDMYLTFVRRDGSWFVASDTDLDDIGLFSVRHPWDLAPTETTRSQSFLGVQRRCAANCDPQFVGLLPLAERALARLDASWPVEWARKVIMVVPPSDAALKRMLQASFDPSKFVAFAYATIDPKDLTYAGNRILVNPPVIAGRAESEVLRILTHELLHVATRSVSGPFTPLFIDEGLAEVVGYAGEPDLSYLGSVVASGAFDQKLPEDFSFSSGSADEIYLSYQEGQSAVRYFIDRWGMKRFVRFYKTLGRERISAGLAGWHLDRALRRTIGVGVRGFEKRWASSIAS